MGTGAGLWIRSELRRRWRALVVLAVLCAIVVCVVLTAVAGARRTTTAYDRYLAETNAYHADVQLMAGLRGRSDVDLGNGKTADDVIAELRRLPQVEALDRAAALLLQPEEGDFYAAVSFDGYAVNRPRLLDGRLPQGVDEMALNEQAAEALHKRVGDTLELRGRSPRQAERVLIEGDTTAFQEPPDGPRVVFRIVGVVEGDVGRVDLSGPYGVVTPEFYARHRDDLAQFAPIASVRLRNGVRDLPALQADVHRLAGVSESVSVEDKSADVAAVNDALDVQALALLLFAGVAAAAGLVAMGIALTRQLAAAGRDGHVLRALGLTRRQRTAAVAIVASPVILVGVVFGLAAAVAASTLLPIGLAGRAEPHPGMTFDAVALPLGGAALAVVLAGIVVFASWRASRTTGGDDPGSSARQDPGLVNRWISRSGVGAVGATGLRLAFETGSRARPTPTRAALTAAVFATAGVTAVLVFAASLANLVAKPELSGFPWHAALTGGQSLEDVSESVTTVADDPGLDAVTVAQLSETTVAGKRTQLLGTRSVKGSAGLTVIEGRAPATPDEVALGPKTLSRLGGRITGQLELATEDGTPRRYRIVGTADFPILNYTDYDNGVWLTQEGLAGVQVGQGNAVVLIRLAPGADATAERSELEEIGFDFENTSGPAKIANLDEVKGFPQALSAFLAVLGLVTVGHALASSPRRRRRELAVLRVFGFVRSQVGAALAVQATAVSAVGVVVGIPLGLAAGRAVWRLVADGLAVVPRPVVPASVLLVALAAIVAANLMAALPARRAATIRPAEVLRTE